MATIRERGPYQWQAQILRKGHPPQYKTFNNKADAERWSRQVEAEMDRGTFVSRREAENTTLSDALDRYEQEVIPGKKGAVQESMRIRIWKRHPLAKRSIASIQGKDIAAYRDQRLKEVAPNTVRHELAVLSHVFTIAVKEWGMEGLVNPVRQIRIPKSPPGRDRRLNPGEIERIVENSGSAMLPAVIQFAIETGMKQAEIAGMTWDMVDIKKRSVTLLETKNGEKRIVPLSLEAVRILSGCEYARWERKDQFGGGSLESACPRCTMKGPIVFSPPPFSVGGLGAQGFNECLPEIFEQKRGRIGLKGFTA